MGEQSDRAYTFRILVALAMGVVLGGGCGASTGKIASDGGSPDSASGTGGSGGSPKDAAVEQEMPGSGGVVGGGGGAAAGGGGAGGKNGAGGSAGVGGGGAGAGGGRTGGTGGASAGSSGRGGAGGRSSPGGGGSGGQGVTGGLGGAGGRGGASGTGGRASSGGAGGASGIGGTGGVGGGADGGGAAGGAGGSASACAPGLLECYDGSVVASCHPAAFTFESGTTDGFTVDTLSSTDGITIANSTARAHTGTHSLVSQISGDNGARLLASVALCGPLEQAMLEGSTLSMWIYLDSTMPLPYPLSTYVQISLSTDGGGIPSHEHIILPGGLPIGVWTQINEYIEIADPGAIHFANEATGLSVVFAVPGPPGWTGAFYLDDITITPAM